MRATSAGDTRAELEPEMAGLAGRLAAYYARNPGYFDGLLPRGTREELASHNNHVFRRYVHPGDLVLDVGGGDGHMAAVLGSGHHVVADLAVPSPERRRERTSGGARLRSSAERLPLADACVDVVLFQHSLEHFVGPDDALNEAERVLRPRGRLLVSGPNYDHLYMPLPMLQERPLARWWARGRILGRQLTRPFAGAAHRPALHIADPAALSEAGPV